MVDTSQIMKAIDQHILTLPHGEAECALETIIGHCEERLESLSWYFSVARPNGLLFYRGQ